MSETARPPDQRLLLISVWGSAAFAVLSLVWGLLIGSQMIIFDGLYSFAAVLLSLLAVLALRTSRKGADERYPWGRQVWEPLTVMVKAVALGGLCVYALIGAVAEILHGARQVGALSAVIYALVATAGSVGVSLYLRRQVERRSDLVRAEAAEWMGDALLSLGVLVGFLIALVLELTGHSGIAAYVDPAMVILVSAAFLRVPARLLAGGFREILTMSPPQSINEQLQACASEVEKYYHFVESFLRASKVGSRLDVEMQFVVGDDSAAHDVHAFDDVREDIARRLEPLGLERSITVSFTADRKWAL